MHQVDTFIGPALTTEESPDPRDFGIIYTVADWVPGADLDDAVGRRGGPHGPRLGRADRPRGRVPPRRPDGPRAAGDRPPRHQAVEHPDHAGGTGRPHRLRRRPTVRGDRPDERRGHPPVAGAGGRRRRRRAWSRVRCVGDRRPRVLGPPPGAPSAGQRGQRPGAARTRGAPGRVPRPGRRRPPHLPPVGAPTDPAPRPPRSVGRRARRRRPPLDGAAPGQAGRRGGGGARGDAGWLRGRWRRRWPGSAVATRPPSGRPTRWSTSPSCSRRRQPAVALAVAVEARHRHQDADTEQGRRPRLRRVRRLRDRRDAAGPRRQRERRRVQRRWPPARQLERRSHRPAVGRRRQRRRSSPTSPSTVVRRPWR